MASLAAASFVTLVACGGSPTSSSGALKHQGAAVNGAALGNGAVATTSVTMSGDAFHPATIRVRAGSTVTWTQEDADEVHNVQFGGAGGFTSPTLHRGQTFRHTFKSPGTYTYICTFHPYMRGTVVVTS